MRSQGITKVTAILQTHPVLLRKLKGRHITELREQEVDLKGDLRMAIQTLIESAEQKLGRIQHGNGVVSNSACRCSLSLMPVLGCILSTCYAPALHLSRPHTPFRHTRDMDSNDAATDILCSAHSLPRCCQQCFWGLNFE